MNSRILLLCHFDPKGIPTIPENINYLKSFSKFEIRIMNFFGKIVPFQISPEVDLNHYSGVLIHNTLSYFPENMQSLDCQLHVKFTDYQGLKILFKQDEHFRTHQVAEYTKRNKFNLVFTCLSNSERSKVYIPEVVENMQFFQMLTGYVTPKMRRLNYPVEDRKIDIGYRGSIQPLIFGQLAYEKQKIGHDVRPLASARGLITNITSRWEERKSGDEWYDFLGNCKATLGVESGANLFDLDGDLEERYANLKLMHGLENENNPEVAERILELLQPLDRKISYNQISPRHFEAAATKTLQILYEGEYSGILKPWVHYVPLKKDYSNFDEICNFLCSDEKRIRIIEKAYEDIIMNSTYWIETFAKQFDRAIVEATTINFKSQKRAKHYLLLVSHYPGLDPRIRWMVEGAPKDICIHVLGINKSDDNFLNTIKTKDHIEVTIPRNNDTLAWLNRTGTDLGQNFCQGQLELALLAALTNTKDPQLIQLLGGIGSVPDFRFFAKYFLNSNSALYSMGLNFKNLSGIISCDLDTLPAGTMLKNKLKLPLIYDAHEFWPDSSANFTQFDYEFWSNMEKRLLPYVDIAVTVSQPLVQYFKKLYRKDFLYVPNCELKSASLYSEKTDPIISQIKSKNKIIFLFQGNFAPLRGVEHLINVWQDIDNKAVLVLRGPNSSHREEMIRLAKSTGLLHKRIFLPTAVSEDELVSSAALCDVGLIPYEPQTVNYENCCPNKLSQYLAAGLPIISSNTAFVQEILREADCGVAVDFHNYPLLSSTINWIVYDETYRKKAAVNALNFFNNFFHWENMSKPIYEKLNITAEGCNRQTVSTHFCSFSTPLKATKYLSRFPLNSKTGSETYYKTIINKKCLKILWHKLPLSFRLKIRSVIDPFTKKMFNA